MPPAKRVVQPDSRECWPVAASAAVYVFFSMILVKTESVIYVGFMDMLQLNRQDASWPLSISLVLSQLAGPVFGLLCLWLSERTILIVGALLCSVPIMACGFAYSLAVINVLYGVLFGLGLACAELVPFSVVARHFVSFRGTALGLLFIVTAVSGFVSPMALEFLRQTYGFRCTLFLVGAIILNMLLGCFIVSRIERTEAVDDPHVPTKTKELLAEPPRVLADRRRSSFQAASLGQSCSIALAESIMSLDKGDRSARAKLLRSLRSLLSLAFIHIGVSRAAALFALTTILITVVDFGEDNGLTGYDAVSLLTAYAIGDLGSRLCTALVLDTRFLSSSATLLCMFALQTAVMAVMSFEKNYWVLLSCCFVTGLSSGGRVFTCTVMVAEEFDEDSISLNLGVMNFVSGFACLIRPPVIGYCRDVLGSYTTLYMLLAIINAVFTVTWSLKVVLSKRKKVPPLRDVLQELPDARGRIGSITSF
ncbi:monocarboxylate transporter 12-like isoform X2 [Amblyomma americanum]|uniref:Major facilitator superfamily (MFS) profile domain-containing protein n=1 Tax=Amblyomma americanum TaxID=6943 RepID=A0AAQ4EU20_AMBAM